MKIGCVKEIKNNEFRVGLTPDNVKAYVARGHHVYMEKGAGWTFRKDLNYYDFTLNEDNITRFNK